MWRLTHRRRYCCSMRCSVVGSAWNSISIKSGWIVLSKYASLNHAPHGYQLTSFRQILEADKKSFEELCDETRAGVQVTAEGRPLDKCFEACMNKSEVVHILQPLPSKASDTVELSRRQAWPTGPPPTHKMWAREKEKERRESNHSTIQRCV